MPAIPKRPRRDMTMVSEWMIVHVLVVTDVSVSDGWSGWIITNRIPAAMAEKPAQWISFAAVIFILLSF
jgi:hypothetical protein